MNKRKSFHSSSIAHLFKSEVIENIFTQTQTFCSSNHYASDLSKQKKSQIIFFFLN
jgi:hypothetical protein